MRATDRSLDVLGFVSDHFRDIIRRRLSELAGLALMTLALLGALALATWSVQDPSLSHATQKPIHNILGYPGAIFSDLAMQLLGLAAILLLAPEALLGWRLLSHKPVGERWRSLFWIVATFLAAAFASTLPHIGSWPLPTGLGGVAGDAMLRLPAMIFGSPVAGFARLVLCICIRPRHGGYADVRRRRVRSARKSGSRARSTKKTRSRTPRRKSRTIKVRPGSA